jgi:sugar lactone lactonase YvrE
MAYDPTSAQLVLTGGLAGTAGNPVEPAGDTWVWTGVTWVRQKPAMTLPGRWAASMQADPGSGHLVLFGGTTLSGNLADTRVWGPLAVETFALPSATSGLNYSTVLAATAGVRPLTWSLASGSMPAGVTVDPFGTISGVPAAAGTFRFTVKVADSSTPAPFSATRALKLVVRQGPRPGVYVANGGNNEINAFPLDTAGNVAPLATIAGSATGLDVPSGLVFNRLGRLFVANYEADTVADYAPGTVGDSAPEGTIGGPGTGLSTPAGITLDASGDLYVADEAANEITVYPRQVGGYLSPLEFGNVYPIYTIAGPDTGLSEPSAVTVDAAGHLWVANLQGNSLTEYAAAANGDARPIATIAGSATGLDGPQALGQDSAGDLLVANTYNNSVTSYGNPGPTGNIFPAHTISGATADLNFPDGLDVDAASVLYVANQFGGVNLFFPPPKAFPLAGPATGLNAPGALAVTPPMTITTSSLSPSSPGRHYATKLRAVLGTAPLHWRLVGGRLPRGLRLSRAGRITGIARRPTTARFTVRVTDSTRRRMTDRRKLSIEVRRPPTISAIEPAHGRARGGAPITIMGWGFATRRGATVFTFGRGVALDLRCRSSRRCTARTPPHAPGAVEARVTVRGLASKRGHRGRFLYTR